MGLEFKSWNNILETQIEDAARKYLGNPPITRDPWPIAFRSDPYSSPRTDLADGAREKRPNIHIYTPQEVVTQAREQKQQFPIEAEKLLREYGKKPLEWRTLVFESKKSLLDGYLGEVARQSIMTRLLSGSILDQFTAEMNYIRLADLFVRLKRIGIDIDKQEKLMAFAMSEPLFNVPFVDINASIWAAIAESYLQGRPVKRGDFYDVPIISAVLPYSDILTTDSYMKYILVNKLRFNDKYAVSILSANNEDRIAFLESIVQLC